MRTLHNNVTMHREYLIPEVNDAFDTMRNKILMENEEIINERKLDTFCAAIDHNQPPNKKEYGSGVTHIKLEVA